MESLIIKFDNTCGGFCSLFKSGGAWNKGQLLREAW